MIVMPSNHSSHQFRALAKQYAGRLGWLQGPRAWKTPCDYIPYALDNDAYTLREKWTDTIWFKAMDKAANTIAPIWVLVPDLPMSRDGTLERWEKYAPIASAYGWLLAFAVQDGMLPEDVPATAAVVFIGGSTNWKWRSLPMWASRFKRVHVGRVNTIRRLWMCEDHGVESVDGSGWFCGTIEGSQGRQLMRWLKGERCTRQQMLL